jgi:hypothetical protein
VSQCPQSISSNDDDDSNELQQRLRKVMDTNNPFDCAFLLLFSSKSKAAVTAERHQCCAAMVESKIKILIRVEDGTSLNKK